MDFKERIVFTDRGRRAAGGGRRRTRDQAQLLHAESALTLADSKKMRKRLGRGAARVIVTASKTSAAGQGNWRAVGGFARRSADRSDFIERQVFEAAFTEIIDEKPSFRQGFG